MNADIQYRDRFILVVLAALGVARAIDLAWLAGFNNFVYARKRLYYLIKLNLISWDYLGREKIYFLTYKGYREIEHTNPQYKVNTKTVHDVGVARIVTYLYITQGISIKDLLTDRQLKYILVKTKIHRPDIVLGHTAYEYERTLKTWARLEQNIKANAKYEKQVWIVPDNMVKIQAYIKKIAQDSMLDNIEIITMSQVLTTVEQADIHSNKLRKDAVFGKQDIDFLKNPVQVNISKYLR